MKIRFSVLPVLFLLTLILAGCKSRGQRVIINSDGAPIVVQVEVARSEKERRNGLMGREVLADGNGMLFIYNPNARPVMWMKDMMISLDLVFIGGDLQIKHVEQGVSPCTLSDDTQCPRYQSTEAVTLVLEMPAGYTQKHGITVGNQVELVGIDGF